MIKRIISIILISLLISLLIITIGNLIKYNSDYNYEAVPFDTHLSLGRFEKAMSLLNQAGYSIQRKIYFYNKEKYDCILTEFPSSSEVKKMKYLDWLKEGRRLIFFGSFRGSFSSENYKSISPEKEHDFFKDVRELHLNTSKTLREKDLLGEKPKKLLNDGEKLFLVQSKYNRGEIITIADSSLFSDKSILKKDNAVLLNNLLKKYFDEPIIIDRVYETEAVERSQPFLFKGIFPYLLLQFLLIFIAYFLWKVKRFGPIINPDQYEKRSLSLHLQAVAYFFEKSGNKALLANIFDKYFIFQLQQTSVIMNLNENNLLARIQEWVDLTTEEQKLFILNQTNNIFELQQKRQSFIKKIRRGELHDREKET